MAPHIGVFNGSMAWMRLTGLEYSPNIPRFISLFLKLLFFLGLVHCLLVAFLGVIRDDLPFKGKLESILLFCLLIPILKKHIQLLKRKEVSLLFSRVNDVLEELEQIYGSDVLIKWKKLCDSVMITYCSIIVFLYAPTIAFAFYKYHTAGITNARPFELFNIFGEDSFYNALLYQSLTLAPAAIIMTTGNTIFASVGIVVSGILIKIREELLNITPSNVDETMRRTVNWHKQVIKIVEEINALFGLSFLADYVLSMVYLSVAAFLVMRVGLYDTTNGMIKSIIIYIVYLSFPLFTCVCGHIIADQSDRLGNSAFLNEWYLLKPGTRKDLLLPGIMAMKGVSLHYRGLVTFDMDAYLLILKQSFSVFTLLKLMDNKEE